jgi:hypothetical protein
VKRFITAVVLSALLLAHLGDAPVTNLNSSETKVAHIAKAEQPVKAEKPDVTIAKVDMPKTQSPESQPEQVPQGCAAYVPLLQQYDWDVSVMAAVMQAESGCNPNAVNPVNYDGIGDYGLMQLHGQEIYDPSQNVAHAYSIWTRQGYHAWSTYNNGAYLRYL